MSLRLLDRMATLVKADAHGVLDALEERALLLRQHVREAELALQTKRARFEGLGREEERLRDSLARLGGELARLDEDVALALAGGREDLARFALKRLLPRRREHEALAAALADVTEERARLGERIAAQERAFEELRARVRARLAAGERGCEDPLAGPAPADDHEVERELLRRRGGDAAGAAAPRASRAPGEPR